jgi:hypothetical protein
LAKPSGAANRKRKREEQRRQEDRSEQVAGSWLQQGAYSGTGDQFDPNAPAVPLPLYGVPPPTLVKAVNAAVVALENGMFSAPAILWDGMLRDDRISATLSVRISGLLGAPLELEPANDDDPAHEAMEDCDKSISKMLPSPQLAQLLRYGLGLAVGVAQVKTARTVKSWTPTLDVWNPRYLRFDQLLRKYCLQTQNRGEIVLEPEDPEWIIYEPYGPLGWMHGALLRSLALPYIIRYWTRTWWARYQEVHGHPIRVGIIPASRNAADERTFLTQITNLAHEAAVRLVQGTDGNKFDLKLIEATANNWEGFSQLLSHCDRSIEVSLLGQSQSTEGQGGLGNQEKAGESTLLRLIKGDALVGDCLREKVIEPWAEDNHGDRELALFEEYQFPLLPVAEQAPQLPEVAASNDVSDVDVASTVDTEREAEPAPEGDMGSDAAKAMLSITPSDLASIVKVDEGRESVGLPPLGGETGGLFIREQGARLSAELQSGEPDAATAAPSTQSAD